MAETQSRAKSPYVTWVPDGVEAIALKLAEAWERRSLQYSQDGQERRFRFQVTPAHKLWPIAMKAARDCLASGVEPGLYVEAQFYYFNRWLGRAPRFGDLCDRARATTKTGEGSWPASQRARRYAALVATHRRPAVVAAPPVVRHPRLDLKAHLRRLEDIARTLGVSAKEAFEQLRGGSVLPRLLVEAVDSGAVAL